MRNTSDWMATTLTQVGCANILPMAAVLVFGMIAAAFFPDSKVVDYVTVGPIFLLPLITGVVSAGIFGGAEDSRKVAVWALGDSADCSRSEHSRLAQSSDG